jgi:hypothetical protein
MQIWKWLLLIGLLFLITYNPSTQTMSKYFDDPRIDVFTEPKREAQSDSGASDDD